MNGGLLLSIFRDYYTIEFDYVEMEFQYRDLSNNLYDETKLLQYIDVAFGGNNKELIMHESKSKYKSLFDKIDGYFNKCVIKLDSQYSEWTVDTPNGNITYELFSKKFCDIDFGDAPISVTGLERYMDKWYAHHAKIYSDKMINRAPAHYNEFIWK